MIRLSHPALGHLGPAEPQTLLQVVEILDLYTAVHQPLQLSLDEKSMGLNIGSPEAKFRLEVLRADVV